LATATAAATGVLAYRSTATATDNIGVDGRDSRGHSPGASSSSGERIKLRSFAPNGLRSNTRVYSKRLGCRQGCHASKRNKTKAPGN
jgi:hypothetical protein